MANDRKETYDDVTAEFPTTNMTPIPKVDYDENAGAAAAYNEPETGTVPGAPYEVELAIKPLKNFGVTITVGGSPRTLRRIGTEGSGEVGIDFNTGLMRFHSSDMGGAYSVARRGLGSTITATQWNKVIKEVIATQTYARTAVIGPASATDNAVARYNLTTGKLIQDSLLIVDDSGNTSTVGTMGASNLSGTNSGNVTLTSGLGNIISISTQLLGLQTQTANTVLAGPVSGGAAAPTFRALGDGDIPLVLASGSARTWRYNEDDPQAGFEFIHKSLSTFGSTGTIVGLFALAVEDTSTGFTRTYNINGATSASTASTDLRLPSASGTLVSTAESPLSIIPATGEISLGTVPIAKGGTNSTATPTAGGIAYGTGTAFAFSSAITADAVVKGNGASAPAASTTLFAGATPKAVSSVDVWMSAVADAQLSIGNTWSADANKLYDEAGGNVAYFGVSARLRPGTIISHTLFVMGGQDDEADGITHVLERRDSASAASTWSEVYSPQTVYSNGTSELKTYALSSPHTVAAGYVYRVKITGVVGNTEARLFDVGVRTTERGL